MVRFLARPVFVFFCGLKAARCLMQAQLFALKASYGRCTSAVWFCDFRNSVMLTCQFAASFIIYVDNLSWDCWAKCWLWLHWSKVTVGRGNVSKSPVPVGESQKNRNFVGKSWKFWKFDRALRILANAEKSLTSLRILKSVVNDPVLTKYLYIQTIDDCVIGVLYETE